MVALEANLPHRPSVLLVYQHLATMAFTVKLLKQEKVTHDVMGLTLERPAGFVFTAGQSIEISLEPPGGPVEKGTYSLLGLHDDQVLQVAMKTTPVNPAINAHLKRLETGGTLQISGPQDEVVYRGPGVFIAGGSGITAFMGIFRQLHKEAKLGGNLLICANKRGEDFCFEGELYTLFGTNLISILAMEDRPRNASGDIDPTFIRRHVSQLEQPFYVCGPEPWVNAVADVLTEVGVAKSRMFLYY